MTQHEVSEDEEPRIKSARTSEVSDRERREKDAAEIDGEMNDTETYEAVVDGGKVASEQFSALHHADWASNVSTWQEWGTFLLDCEEKLLRQSRIRNIDQKHISDYENMMMMFSRFLLLADSDCERCKVTTESRLFVSHLNREGGKFVQIVKGEFSCGEKEYQSSLKWFVRSIERLMEYLEEGPVPSRPGSSINKAREIEGLPDPFNNPISDAMRERVDRATQADPISTELFPAGLWSGPQENEKQVIIQDDHEWNVYAEFFHLPNYMIKGSGLVSCDHKNDLVLYNRPACKEQVKFILESVVKDGDKGFIFGQPGTGKSTTTFYVCCSLRHEHDIVWIHLEKSASAKIVIVKGNVVRKLTLQSVTNLDQIIGHKAEQASKTILVIDSCLFKNPQETQLVEKAADWRNEDPANRRLITVSSMAAYANIPTSLGTFVSHAVGEWSIEEYLIAIENDEFWESVRHTFPEDGTKINARRELVESKLYYAGTCPRFMFGSSIDQIKETISKAITSMSPRTNECTSTNSILSKAFRHTLISFVYIPHRGFVKTGFVSHYAAQAFGTCSTAEAMRALSKQCLFDMNSKARGWVFEAFFLASASERADIIVRTASRDQIVWNCPHPEARRVVVFRPKTLRNKIPLDTWLQPDSPQQPGFDAVMLLSNGLIRFIQTTVAREHDLKMSALADLVIKLQQLGHEVTDAEVFFVIPDDAFANEFVISKLHEWEKFVKLFKSWSKKLDDVKKKLHTVMIGF